MENNQPANTTKYVAGQLKSMVSSSIFLQTKNQLACGIA